MKKLNSLRLDTCIAASTLLIVVLATILNLGFFYQAVAEAGQMIQSSVTQAGDFTSYLTRN